MKQAMAGKLSVFVLLTAFVSLSVISARAAEVDSYVDRDYDFAQMKRLYLWPAECENIPGNVRLSLPGLIEDWTSGVLADKKRMRFMPQVKSTKQMWEDIQLIKGPLGFADPFENAETSGRFYSLLGEACEGVLKTSVSVTQERRWQEPKTETYMTTVRIKKTKRRKNQDGKWENIETWIDMPVTKKRVIQGRWLADTLAVCEAELYDASSLNGKYIAAARSEERSSRDESEAAKAAREAAKKALRAALARIFYKK